MVFIKFSESPLQCSVAHKDTPFSRKGLEGTGETAAARDAMMHDPH